MSTRDIGDVNCNVNSRVASGTRGNNAATIVHMSPMLNVVATVSRKQPRTGSHRRRALAHTNARNSHPHNSGANGHPDPNFIIAAITDSAEPLSTADHCLFDRDVTMSTRGHMHTSRSHAMTAQEWAVATSWRGPPGELFLRVVCELTPIESSPLPVRGDRLNRLSHDTEVTSARTERTKPTGAGALAAVEAWQQQLTKQGWGGSSIGCTMPDAITVTSLHTTTGLLADSGSSVRVNAAAGQTCAEADAGAGVLISAGHWSRNRVIARGRGMAHCVTVTTPTLPATNAAEIHGINSAGASAGLDAATSERRSDKPRRINIGGSSAHAIDERHTRNASDSNQDGRSDLLTPRRTRTDGSLISAVPTDTDLSVPMVPLPLETAFVTESFVSGDLNKSSINSHEMRRQRGTVTPVAAMTAPALIERAEPDSNAIRHRAVSETNYAHFRSVVV